MRSVPDNSTESGNFILWYQSKRFQTRIAYNYRSPRAVGQRGRNRRHGNVRDGSEIRRHVGRLQVNKYAEVFVNGTNLTNEYQRSPVWSIPAGALQPIERMLMFGMRGQW
jgi:hypothetical protein